MKYKLLILSFFVSLASYCQLAKPYRWLIRDDSVFIRVEITPGDSTDVHIPVGHLNLTSTFFLSTLGWDSSKANIRNELFNLIGNNTTALGRDIMNKTPPSENSILVGTPGGNSVWRNGSQLLGDIGAAPLNSPAFTGTPTGIGIPVYARVTGSNATTTGQALVDIAGLSIPLTTNAIYEISGMLSVSTTGTAGVQYGLNYSVAGGTVEAQLSGSLTSTATKTERISVLNAASTAYLTTSGQTGGIIIRGIITTGANAGNLTVKFLKVTSGTATVFQNSVLKVTRIQ